MSLIFSLSLILSFSLSYLDKRSTGAKLLGIFDIDAMSDINWPTPDDAMKQVILSNEQRSLLLANCRDGDSVHQSPDWVADSAGQKGAGKLFLLHGNPMSAGIF